MRLIDADALMESAGLFHIKACARGCGKSTLHLAKAWLSNEVTKSPTIDAVPVVRCKDCKHYEAYPKPVEDFDGRCSVRGCETDEPEFCSYGERRCDNEM